MGEKTLFEILMDMNLLDIEEGSRTLRISGGPIHSEEIKQGTKLTFGVDKGTTTQLMNDEVMAFAVLLDKKTYNKLKSGNSKIFNKGTVGTQAITKERLEQIHKHGKSIELDVSNNTIGQLPEAAINVLKATEFPPSGWDENIWHKMINKSYKERLIIAGALIAADIDRLDAIEK